MANIYDNLPQAGLPNGDEILTFEQGGVIARSRLGDLFTVDEYDIAVAVGRTANTVLAGPATGGPLPPAFRSLVLADLPPLVVDVSTGLAAAGTIQGTALALTTAVNEVITVSTGVNDGVVLPSSPSSVSITVRVFNRSGFTLKVYPQTGAQIDSLGANNPYSLATLKAAAFTSVSAFRWYSMLGA